MYNEGTNTKHAYVLIDAHKSLYNQQDNFCPKPIHQTHWSELVDKLNEPVYQFNHSE